MKTSILETDRMKRFRAIRDLWDHRKDRVLNLWGLRFFPAVEPTLRKLWAEQDSFDSA